MDFELTPEILSSLAGVILSLLFSYIPGLNVKFAALCAETKRLIMAGLLLLISAGIFGLSCGGILSAVTCDQAGILRLVWMFVMAVVANQSTYQITPLPTAVREARAECT